MMKKCEKFVMSLVNSMPKRITKDLRSKEGYI